MATHIEWADETWNPVTGCDPISEGCEHCYAKRMARRLAGRFGYPAAPHQFDVTIHEGKMDQPLHWKKPRRIFVCSMSDLFHADVPTSVITAAFNVMERATQHTFLVLTKRVVSMIGWYALMRLNRPAYRIPSNVLLGVTAENQARADERIPILLQIPAAGYFVSLEPMLGAVDLRHVHSDVVEIDALAGDHGVYRPLAGRSDEKLSWVIIGSESGPRARPMEEDWARKAIEQCKEAQVPVFYKQQIVGGKRVHLPLMDGVQYAEYPEALKCQN